MRYRSLGLSILLAACGPQSDEVLNARNAREPVCVHFGGPIRSDGLTLAYETPVRVDERVLADILAQIPGEEVKPTEACVYLRDAEVIEVVPEQGVAYVGHWFKFDGGRWMYFKSEQTGWVS